MGAASTAPVYVILSDGRKGSPQNSLPQYRIEQLPSGFTTGELANQLNQSASEAGGHLRMLVSPSAFDRQTEKGRTLQLVFLHSFSWSFSVGISWMQSRAFTYG